MIKIKAKIIRFFKNLLKFVHYLVMFLTFPLYFFMFLNVKILEGLFNISIRPYLFDYTKQREDRFYAKMSLMFFMVYSFLAFGYIGLFVENFDLGRFEYYYYLYLEYKPLIIWGLAGSFIYVLIDYLIFDKYINNLKKPKPTGNKKMELRKKAIKKGVIFVGIDKETDEPIFLSDSQRSLHVLTAGTTGTGKSQSFIFPWAFQDLARDKGLIIVDPKGDLKFFEKLYTYYNEEVGGDKTFRIVNIADPKGSHTYNPIFNGNAIEIKDRIMSSFEWSEEFYRTKAESILITLLQAIESIDKKVTFHDLYELLTERSAVIKLYNQCEDGFYKNQLLKKIIGTDEDDFKEVKNQCSGLINNIDLMAHSSMGKIVNTYNPDVNILDVYREDEIVFFSLPSQQLGQTARAFGKMLLMDMKSTSGYIEQKGASKHFFPVYIDEFAEFATEEFVGWLNKARSSGFCIHIAFQSLGDLEQVNDAFVKQVLDNTNIKMIFRVNDPDTAESFASQLGTHTVKRETERLEKDLLTESEGLMGSVREVEEFIVHTNVIKNLEMGQCLFFTKHPTKIHGIINTDYIPDKDNYDTVKIQSNLLIPYNDEGQIENLALLIDPDFFFDTLECPTPSQFLESKKEEKAVTKELKTSDEVKKEVVVDKSKAPLTKKEVLKLDNLEVLDWDLSLLNYDFNNLITYDLFMFEELNTLFSKDDLNSDIAIVADNDIENDEEEIYQDI